MYTEHVELVSALNELSEVQEYQLYWQESLQAIENELKTENEQDKPPHKKSKKSSSGNLLNFLLFQAVFIILQDNMTSLQEGKKRLLTISLLTVLTSMCALAKVGMLKF